MVERYKLYYRLFLAIFWIETCYGFVAEELLPFMDSARNVTMLLCDMLTLLLGLLTIRNKRDLTFFGAFAVLGVLSTIILNGESMLTLFNGSRDFFGLLFAVPILRWFLVHERSSEFKRLWIKQLDIWLWLQALCITEQFIRYGANDHGGGTMGEGASGMTSTMIYLISFFLITRNWDSSNYFASLRKNWRYIFLLYPTFLNETKVSFIFLVAYLLLLIKYDRKVVLRLVYILPAGIVGILALGSFYMNVTEQDAEKVLSEEFFEQYLYGINLDEMIDVAIMVQDGDIEVDPRDWWVVDIPRLAKIVLIIPELRDCRGGLSLGAGVGQFKGGTLVKETKFATYNQWLLQGSRPWVFFVITQLGVIGVIWWVLLCCCQIFTRHSKRPCAVKMQLLMALLLGIILLYNDSLRFFNYDVLLFSMALLLKYFKPEPELKFSGFQSR